MMGKLIFALLMITRISAANGQPVVNVGERMPFADLEVVNYSKSVMRTAEWKGKAVIFDFWATWCTSCIAHFSFLDSLQRENSNALQIILVNPFIATKDTKEMVKAFFSNWQKRQRRPFTIPSVVMDTAIEHQFPHRSFPHYVWIDANGIVQAVTDASMLNRENVQLLIAGKLKRVERVSYDRNKPLLDGNGASNENILYRSMFTGYLQGVNGGASIRKNGLFSRICLVNQSLALLCMSATGKSFALNKVVLEGLDREKTLNTEFNPAWLYCYELIAPPVAFDSFNNMVKHEIESFFSIKISFEKRMIRSMVITSDTANIRRSAQNEKAEMVESPEERPEVLKNYPLSDFVGMMNRYQKIPLVDLSGYHGKISLKLPEDLSDPALLKQAMEPNGWVLREMDVEMEVLVIRSVK